MAEYDPNRPDPSAPENQPNAAVVLPIIQQITGGNPAATAGAQAGQAAATKSGFGDIGAAVQEVTNKLGAVFQAGQSSGAEQAQKAVDLAKAQSDAVVQSGVAGAMIARGDALALAARDAAIAKDVVTLGLDPNNPSAIKTMTDIKTSQDTINLNVGKLQEMHKVGFFDSPGKFLLNQIVNIPLAEERTKDALGEMKATTEGLAAQTQALQNRGLVDAALHSVNTTDRADLVYKQALAQTTAAGIKPAIDAQQTELSAFQLAVSQRNSDISAAHLQLDKKIAQNNFANEAARLRISEADLGLAQNRDIREQATLNMQEASHKVNLATAEWELTNNQDLAPDKKDLLRTQIVNEKAALGFNTQNAAIQQGRFDIEKGEKELRSQLLSKQVDYYDAAHEATIQQTQARAAELTAVREQILKKDSTDKQTISELNDTLNYFGGGRTITDVNRLPQHQRDALLEMTTNLRAFGQPAQNPADALALIKAAGIPLNQLRAEHQVTVHALDGIQQEVLQKVMTIQPGEEKPTGAVLTDRVRSGVYAQIAGEQNNISSSNQIFQMPTVNTILSQGWAAKNPLAQAMTPLTVDGSGKPVNRQMDGSLLVNTAAQLIADKKLAPTQAVAALKDFATNTLNDIKRAGGFDRFAIPVAEKFPVKFQTAGGLLGSSVSMVDLYNTADIQAKLLKQVAEIANKQHIGPGGLLLAPFGALRGVKQLGEQLQGKGN